MLFGILVTFFVIICLFLILLILIQKGKGSMGLGNMGGGTQMIFGSSGGQDFFQKVSWVLSAIFMLGALGLALLKSHEYNKSRYLNDLVTKPETEQTQPQS